MEREIETVRGAASAEGAACVWREEPTPSPSEEGNKSLALPPREKPL